MLIFCLIVVTRKYFLRKIKYSLPPPSLIFFFHLLLELKEKICIAKVYDNLDRERERKKVCVMLEKGNVTFAHKSTTSKIFVFVFIIAKLKRFFFLIRSINFSLRLC